MQKHAEGCGNLWSKQNQTSQPLRPDSRGPSIEPTKSILKVKPSERVVLPVFVDIVRLALKEREECLKRYVKMIIEFKKLHISDRNQIHLPHV